MEIAVEKFPDLTRGDYWKFSGTRLLLNFIAEWKQTRYTRLIRVRMRVFEDLRWIEQSLFICLRWIIWLLSDTCQVRRSRSSNRYHSMNPSTASHHQLATHRCIDSTEFHHRIHHHVCKRCTGTHHQNKHNPPRPHHRCNRESRRTATTDRCTRDRWWARCDQHQKNHRIDLFRIDN